MKDDNLGLGAKRGSERAENFGLAGLESILGRLNGNEAEVKKEEERREEIEKRAFVYRKYGMMNFVSGGLLVGDKIVSKTDFKKEEPEVKVEVKTEPQSDDSSTNRKEKKDKKRKRLEIEEPNLKRKKKSLDLRDKVRDEAEGTKKKDKKSKKEKSNRSNKSSSDSEDAPSPKEDALTDKARRKAEKKARKEEKKHKKALKKAAKSKDESDDSSSEDEENTPSSSAPATGTSTPIPSTAGLTFAPRGMHAVRQRFIRQKKAATMDAQAMKEVCGVAVIMTARC